MEFRELVGGSGIESVGGLFRGFFVFLVEC